MSISVKVNGEWKQVTPSPSVISPKASGVASSGISDNYAREDHVHPSSGEGGGATIIANMNISGNSSVTSGQSSTFTLSATSLLNSGKIDTFIISASGSMNIQPTQVTASSNSASYTLNVPTLPSNSKINLKMSAVDNYGNISSEIIKELTVIQAFINQPSITAPQNGSEVMISSGLTVSTSAFSVTGGTDTHKNTDWIISSDSNRENVVAQALASSDKTSYTFTSSNLSSMTNGNNYYISARHRGNNLGESAWANNIMVTANQGLLTAGGRLLYRHSSNKGTVIEFDMFGTTVKLLVADAQYRTKQLFGAHGKDSSLTNFFRPTLYINDFNHSSTDAAPTVTDATLQSRSTEFKTDKTARQNCDVWMTYQGTTDSQDITGVPAVEHCRSLTNIISGGMDIPNAYELCVIWLESDNLDAMDPTASTYPMYRLGKDNTSGGRFCADGIPRYWTSTESSSNFVWNVSYNGECDNNFDKSYISGVVPVRELEISENVPVIPEIPEQNNTYEFAGRKIYRHDSLPGSVIEYNEFGTAKKILVFDAVYRSNKTFGQFNVDIPGLNTWNHSYYPTCTGNVIDSDTGYTNLSQVADLTPYSAQLSDVHFQAALTATLKPVLQSAKAATDILMNYSDTDAAHWCREKGQEIGIEGQLPNIYQLFVLYACGDIIDSLDPTVASHAIYALGMYDINFFRWFLGNSVYTLSSTDHSALFACGLDYIGCTHTNSKLTTYGVVPIAEL